MSEKLLNNTNVIQSVIESQIDDDYEEDIEELDFDPLYVYFGDDYVVNEKIKIHQPTIQDFITNRESNIYNVITPFIVNTTGCRVQLWNMGIDWNKISDFELFSFMIKNIDYNYSKIIFGNIDFSKFVLCKKTIDNETRMILYNPIIDLEIDDDTRIKMCKYIQYAFHAFPPEEEFTSNRILKQELINNDKQKLMAQRKAQKENQGHQLLSMISFCLNHPGFKYKKDELRNVCIAEFMDSVERLQLYESTRALYNGVYSGFVDTSKISKNEFDFMRSARAIA